MSENPNPNPNPNPTILDTLGEEIIRILTPVSICMFSLVLLVKTLTYSTQNLSSIATLAYSETDSSTNTDNFIGALLNSLVFVAVITVTTFLLVVLFYYRCTGFLKWYMGFSSFIVLAFFGGEIGILLVGTLNVPVDFVTFAILMFNFAIIGVLAVFMGNVIPKPILQQTSEPF